MPILLGVVPFALITGIAAVESGLTPLQSIGANGLAFAGASQLAAYQLLAVGGNPLVIILTTWVINLRFMLYSASMGPYLQTLPVRWKAPLAFIMTDQAYAVSVLAFESGVVPEYKHWFYLGAAGMLWVIWQICTLAGALLGAQVPASWSLDFAIPLTFAAILVPTMRDNPSRLAALTAGVLVTLLIGLPFNLGLPLGVLVGIGAGLLLEKSGQRRAA